MDIIEQAINGTAKMLAKILTGKETENEVTIEQPATASNFLLVLNAMVSEGKINEAENILFEELEKSCGNIGLYEIGLDFFARLSKLSKEELERGNYTFAEIEQGKADLKALMSNYWGNK